jgi:hypothetical protein
VGEYAVRTGRKPRKPRRYRHAPDVLAHLARLLAISHTLTCRMRYGLVVVRHLLPAIAVVIFSACNDPASTTTPTKGASVSDLEATCRSECDWQARCHVPSPNTPDAGTSCVQTCLGKLGPIDRHVRLDVTRALTSCYEGLACGGNDDGCTTMALASIGGSVDAAIHAPDVTACLAKHEACKATSDDILADLDDVCSILPLLVDEERAALMKCFERPCSEVTACTGAKG